MKSILSTDYYVHFNNHAFIELEKYLNEYFHSKLFILVDANTREHCLPHLLKQFEEDMNFEIIE